MKNKKEKREKIFTEQLVGKGYNVNERGDNIIVSKGTSTAIVNKKTISPIKEDKKK